MGRKLLTAVAILVATFVAKPVYASALPSFPSCNAPAGSVIADNSSGDHGVPGNQASFGGSDTVYGQDNGNALQCLCSNGSGIQTTWWNVTGMSTEDVQSYINAGWTYIPDGSGWGLQEAPYLALNINYSCGGSVHGDSTTNNGGDNPGAPVCNDQAPKSAPVLTSAVVNGDNSVILTWTPAADPVSYYLIAYGTTPGNYIYGNPNVGGHDTTSYTVHGLSGGVTYYFIVRAGNGCMPGPFSNSKSSQTTGTVVTGPAEGFTPTVLGTSDTTTLVDGTQTQTAAIAVCGCVWLPILVAEIILLAALFIYKRDDANWKRRFLFGFGLAVVSYVVFLIWNRHCTGGIMNFKFFTIPCKYFWAVAGAVWLLLFAILRKSKKNS